MCLNLRVKGKYLRATLTNEIHSSTVDLRLETVLQRLIKIKWKSLLRCAMALVACLLFHPSVTSVVESFLLGVKDDCSKSFQYFSTLMTKELIGTTCLAQMTLHHRT